MYKILEFTKEGLFLNLNRGFIEVKENDIIKSISIDDVKSIIISGYGLSITTSLIRELLDRKVAITFCDDKFMPSGILLPQFGSGALYKRIHLQVQMSEPFKKSIWKEIVSKKIYFQAEVLKYFTNDDAGLISFSKNILSGDSDNKEAQAAKRYWGKLFLDFKRGDDSNFINIALNYGYTVLRSSISRSIVSQGLHPSFGVFHDNKENNFCLADDLMEIFRPLVDFKIKSIFKEDHFEEMTPELKRKIITFIYCDLRFIGNEKSPLFQCIEKLISSFCSSLENKKCDLLFPFSIIPFSD
jgi:CRISPR-associated protein Cas1